MGPDDVEVAYSLHGLGTCVRKARRLGEAEEAELGPMVETVAITLFELAG